MIQKNIQKWMQYFRILSKNCGVLRYKGREYNINEVTSTGYILQDAFAHERPFPVSCDDAEITDVELVPEFKGFFQKSSTPATA